MWLSVGLLGVAWASLPVGVERERTVHHWRGGRIVHETPDLSDLPYDGVGAVRFESEQGVPWLSARELPAIFPDSTVPSVGEERSLETVQRGWNGAYVGRGTLVVFPENGRAHLSWRHQVHALGGVWSVYVDAHKGTVIAAEAESWSIRAMIYESNVVDSELAVVDLNGLYRGRSLRGEYAFATKCTDWRINPAPFGERICLDWTFAAKPGPVGDFFEHPNEGNIDDPFAQPNVYHHVDTIARWADERYALALDYPIHVMTNFPLTNAFFGDFDDDGDRDLSFGISDDGYNFAYDADVVHHEYGHALVRLLAGSMWMQADSLGIDWTPGALNEGVADSFAMVLNPDPLLAEGMGRSDRWDGAIRNHEPDRVCPDDLQAQVHRSGQIWGSMIWNLVDDPMVGPELVGDLVVAAVSTWDNDTNWPDAAESMITMATRLLEVEAISETTHDAIVGHIEASGMLDCERIIDLEVAPSMTQVLLNLGLSGEYERLAGGVQFKRRIPPESSAIQLSVRNFNGANQGSGLALYLRLDEPIEHEATRIDGIGLHHAIPTKYDAVIELDQEHGVFMIDDSVVSGFENAAVLFGSLASINRNRAPLDADYMSLSLSAVAVQRSNEIVESTTSTGCGVAQRRSNILGMIAVLVLLLPVMKRDP